MSPTGVWEPEHGAGTADDRHGRDPRQLSLVPAWRRFRWWWSEHNHRHRFEVDPDCPTRVRSCTRCLKDEYDQSVVITIATHEAIVNAVIADERARLAASSVSEHPASRREDPQT